LAYKIVDGEVLYRGMIVDRADAATFVPLAWTWARDANRAYADGCVVGGAVPASFVPLDALYGSDTHQIFAGPNAIEADVATFRVLGGGYAVDARTVFCCERRLGSITACWTLETADPATLKVLAHRWAVDTTHAYCVGFVCEQADPARLVPLTRWLATDGRHVFTGSRVLPGADPATFRALDEHYGVDATNVFHGEILARAVKHANRATFRVLGDNFAADDQFAFWESEVLAGIAPDALRPLSPSFACAGEQLLYFYSGIHGERQIVADIWGTKPIVLAGADSSTFRDLGELYGADAARAYYHSTPIELRGDARRLEVLGPSLARDDAAVYFENEVVEGADPSSFRLVAAGGVARDRAHWYQVDVGGDYQSIVAIDADRARQILDGDD
jgi:DKNYY family